MKNIFLSKFSMYKLRVTFTAKLYLGAVIQFKLWMDIRLNL